MMLGVKNKTEQKSMFKSKLAPHVLKTCKEETFTFGSPNITPYKTNLVKSYWGFVSGRSLRAEFVGWVRRRRITLG